MYFGFCLQPEQYLLNPVGLEWHLDTEAHSHCCDFCTGLVQHQKLHSVENLNSSVRLCFIAKENVIYQYLFIHTDIKPTANQHRAYWHHNIWVHRHRHRHTIALLVIAEFFYLLVSKHVIGYLQVVMYTRDNLVKMLCTHHMNCCVLHIHPSSVFWSLALQFVERKCANMATIKLCLSLSAQTIKRPGDRF